MSVNRSSSQVRNLRAMFENPTPSTPDSTSPERGRSNANGHLSPGPNGERPLSRVRSSFVSVEPNLSMEIDPEKSKQEHGARHESTASFRRESFSFDDAQDSGAIANLRKTISQESERRGSNPMVAETIPEAAIEATPAATTPAVEAKDYMAAGVHTTNEKPDPTPQQQSLAHTQPQTHSKLSTVALPGDGSEEAKDVSDAIKSDDDMPAENPDKPVSGLQGEPGPMQPSDLKDRAAVSPAPATQTEEQQPATPVQLPTRARRGTVTEADIPASAGKSATAPVAVDPPAPVAVDPPTPAAPTPSAAPTPAAPSSPHRPSDISVSKPAESSPQPKTPTSAKKAPTQAKPSPASSARSPQATAKTTSAAAAAAAAAKSKSPQAKPTHPRSPTRPVKLPSHLTAPTAASAAKHDAQPSKPAVSKPTTTTRTQPRPSTTTAKPAPRSSMASATAAPKKTEPRPAATSSRAPDEGFLARMMRPTASSASKVHDKTEVKTAPKRTPSVIKSKVSAKPKTTKIEKPASQQTNGSSKEAKQDTDAAAGAATPQAASGAQDAALESTPAFDAATIR